MIINPKKLNRNITAKVSDVEIECVKAYIQGAVHSHCNTSPGKPFSVRILFGGKNKDWSGTPLQCIYDYHKDIRQSKDPANQAAKDIGWLFKQVLESDSRKFCYIGKDTGNIFKLISE